MAHSTYPLISESARHAVTVCPKCRGTNIKGPHDTGRSATFLFTRAWYCRDCWWDRELKMKDDIAEAKAKAEATAAKNEAQKNRKRGVA